MHSWSRRERLATVKRKATPRSTSTMLLLLINCTEAVCRARSEGPESSTRQVEKGLSDFTYSYRNAVENMNCTYTVLLSRIMFDFAQIYPNPKIGKRAKPRRMVSKHVVASSIQDWFCDKLLGIDDAKTWATRLVKQKLAIVKHQAKKSRAGLVLGHQKCEIPMLSVWLAESSYFC